MLEWLAESRPGAKLTKELKRVAAVKQNYVHLCHVVRMYLDAELKDDRESFRQVAEKLSATVLGQAWLGLEVAAIGESSPTPYSHDSSTPPTPRQLRPLLMDAGVDEFREALERHRLTIPKSPIYDSSMTMGSLLYELVENDRLKDAQAIHRYAQSIDIDGVSTLRFLGYMSQLVKNMDQARHFLTIAMEIDPEDPETLRKLKELGEGE